MAGYVKGPSRKWTPRPRHGEILAYYIVVYDRHIGREILIPASKLDILKGTVRLP